MAKTIERVCRNCRLYNPTEGTCQVTVLHEGERYELPVQPNDRCHWEAAEAAVSRQFGERVEVPIQQVRMWSDGTNGFIEAPDEFGS